MDGGGDAKDPDGKRLLTWFGYVIIVDKEGELQLPHLVWTDAHIILNGAVVLQCWGGKEGEEDREEKEKGKDSDNEGNVE